MKRNMLNLKNTGAFLGISPRTVRRLIDRKQLTYYKIGGLIKIDEKDIETYIDKSRVDITN